MPNKIKRNKRDKPRLRRPKRSADSVKDLLAGANPALTRLSEQTARQALWRAWLTTHLPPAARVHVSGIVERHDTLVIFTASAAWSARVRFAVAEIEEALKRAHPRIAHANVDLRRLAGLVLGAKGLFVEGGHRSSHADRSPRNGDDANPFRAVAWM